MKHKDGTWFWFVMWMIATGAFLTINEIFGKEDQLTVPECTARIYASLAETMMEGDELMAMAKELCVNLKKDGIVK